MFYKNKQLLTNTENVKNKIIKDEQVAKLSNQSFNFPIISEISIGKNNIVKNNKNCKFFYHPSNC